MSTKEKLIERFKSLPNDFTFEELIRLMGLLGFSLDNKGNTSGSRIRFHRDDHLYDCHRPHPGNVVKRGVLRDLYHFLLLKGIL